MLCKGDDKPTLMVNRYFHYSPSVKSPFVWRYFVYVILTPLHASYTLREVISRIGEKEDFKSNDKTYFQIKKKLKIKTCILFSFLCFILTKIKQTLLEVLCYPVFCYFCEYKHFYTDLEFSKFFREKKLCS